MPGLHPMACSHQAGNEAPQAAEGQSGAQALGGAPGRVLGPKWRPELHWRHLQGAGSGQSAAEEQSQVPALLLLLLVVER